MSANLDRRFSPAEVSVWRRLPGSPARTFAVASALGRSVRADGTFGPLRGGRDVVGVVVGPAQRRRIREALELSERRWREFLRLVEELGIGHRCRRGVVTLFVRAGVASCPNPNCDADLPDVRSLKDRRDHRRSTGGITAARPAGTPPLAPRENAHLAAETEPFTGDASRGWTGGWSPASTPVGDGKSEVGRGSTTSGAAVAKSESMCICGHGFTLHYINGPCKRPSCLCERPRRREDVEGVLTGW